MTTNNHNQTPRFLTIKEAAELFGCHQNTVRKWINEGLPYYRAGNIIRVHNRELYKWLEKNRRSESDG